jgi:hypothetical protein
VWKLWLVELIPDELAAMAMAWWITANARSQLDDEQRGGKARDIPQKTGESIQNLPSQSSINLVNNTSVVA